MLITNTKLQYKPKSFLYCTLPLGWAHTGLLLLVIFVCGVGMCVCLCVYVYVCVSALEATKN